MEMPFASNVFRQPYGLLLQCPFLFRLIFSDSYQDAVVLMTQAKFGRMHIGECVREALGYMPCHRDVLRLMDARCSGHPSCRVNVMDSALRSVQPCSQEVTWHLEASYDCVKLTTGNRMECVSQRHSSVSPSSGFLGTAGSKTTSGPGTAACPYRVRGEPGQRVNVTLYNFASTQDSGDISRPDVCHEMAVLRDGGSHGPKREFTLCSREPRVVIQRVSESHIVDIHFVGRSSESGVQFLLKYEIIGCGSFKLPTGSYANRKGNRMTIHCNKTDQHWTLHCRNDHWVGQVGNCSYTHNEATDWSVDDLFGDESNFPYGILIVVAVGVALGIFLGGSLLFLASIYIKRFWFIVNAQRCVTAPHERKVEEKLSTPSEEMHSLRSKQEPCSGGVINRKQITRRLNASRRKRQRYLNRNIPDCVLTSQHDPHCIRPADDALCLEGKPYVDSDYDPCEFRGIPVHALHQTSPRDAVLVQKSGKAEITCSTGGGKGTLGHGAHVQYGSNARPCQHHYESPAFS
ncbi:hypothetical protein CAPTEDRAFT_210325 [Capitella teleta]|uniref:CUB domain-containing protein n=1 Tax=Capitella teleta TaxID=283909 RepID=N1PB41_CAPTE|nr:hypothetical protein CAPTEDRAFT_210325 [Capitella teleta]|eukprot:ELU18852.1 hypothetical protein CAPTEDRAFT_210325 [Capitella teleta]